MEAEGCASVEVGKVVVSINNDVGKEGNSDASDNVAEIGSKEKLVAITVVERSSEYDAWTGTEGVAAMELGPKAILVDVATRDGVMVVGPGDNTVDTGCRGVVAVEVGGAV